jgi:hypothetical protein
MRFEPHLDIRRGAERAVDALRRLRGDGEPGILLRGDGEGEAVAAREAAARVDEDRLMAALRHADLRRMGFPHALQAVRAHGEQHFAFRSLVADGLSHGAMRPLWSPPPCGEG